MYLEAINVRSRKLMQWQKRDAGHMVTVSGQQMSMLLQACKAGLREQQLITASTSKAVHHLWKFTCPQVGSPGDELYEYRRVCSRRGADDRARTLSNLLN